MKWYKWIADYSEIDEKGNITHYKDGKPLDSPWVEIEAPRTAATISSPRLPRAIVFWTEYSDKVLKNTIKQYIDNPEVIRSVIENSKLGWRQYNNLWGYRIVYRVTEPLK